MSNETRIALGIICAVGFFGFVVSWFPALTSGGVSSVAPVSAEEYDRLVTYEQSHCETNLEGVNCTCFAGVSGLIQADRTSRVPSAYYADKQDLARGQAEDKC